MNRRLAFLALLLVPLLAHARSRVSFNEGWRFHKGEAEGAEKVSYDAASWRALKLPHDWAIEGPFDKKYNARCGGLPFHGTGWYRKEFTLPSEAQGQRVALLFDGAMYDAHVWLNGQFLGSRPFGYIGFEFDLTPFLKSEGSNVLAVRLQPEDLSSRWYPGAGIYRNAWLITGGDIHVPQWGSFVTTPKVSDEIAEVRVENQIRHAGSTQALVTAEVQVLDPAGKQVAISSTTLGVNPGETISQSQSLDITEPQRWDMATPVLYTAVTRILDGEKELDRHEASFGIRTVEYKAGEGLFLNGRHVRIKGVCMHHDLGALGAAVNFRATERQMEIMKSMGVNSIRTSHNPPSPELLEICDRMGLLVQVEAFDCWRMPKVENGYNKFFDAWHERDLRDMIRRDRNHPSVIMWSIGNEILEQGEKDGWKLARHLHQICKDEDPTRLTSAGFNFYPASVMNGLAAEVDIPGFNYKPLAYAEVTRQHPDWHILGSETSSCVSSRGVYHLPIEKYEKHEDLQVTSYDLIGPVWAYPPDIEFEYLKKNSNVLGEYMWTGFDYLGEPTPYGGRDNSTNGYWNGDWPVHSSYFGAVDLCGFPKDRYFLYQSQWLDVKESPMVHLLPHWNWEERKGEPIPVYVYTNGAEAELFLNGKSLGRKVKGRDTTPIIVKFNHWEGGDFSSPYRLRWDVPFEAGELKVVAYDLDGKAIAEKAHHTAGEPAMAGLEADRAVISADGEDLSFITVKILDKDGNFCPKADHELTFEIDGPAEIAGVNNGDPASLESFQGNQRRAFSGMAQVILRGVKGKAGTITLTAKAEGLRDRSLQIESK
ncbi:beta-galactosidase GalB [Haloferula chungangensis]|uniref:Beta-galactosidase GalB n=1 Tax=Haloferula chungangensis TaxID=1048331 RepID=A0ABW2L9B4_9BACT